MYTHTCTYNTSNTYYYYYYHCYRVPFTGLPVYPIACRSIGPQPPGSFSSRRGDFGNLQCWFVQLPQSLDTPWSLMIPTNPL